ncbi:MAG: O-antigen polysaccharide polymerase Wzy [Gemmatimonadota bacterium]
MFCALIGVALSLEPNISELDARWYSLVATGVALVCAWWLDSRVSNWALWFFFSYFALYQAGNLVGLVVLGGDQSVLDYPTTFANGLTIEARASAYLVSGIAAGVLATLSALWPPPATRRLPAASPRLERWSRLMVLISAPACATIFIMDASKLAAVGYAALYSADFQTIGANVPLRGLWTNLNSIGFALWFASVPREKYFKWMAPLFVLLALLDSLKGARILLLVPVAFVLWYRAYVYGHDHFSRTAKVVVAGTAAAFAFGVEILRQEGGSAVEALSGFLIFSVSKAQYTLALFLEHRDTLDASGGYWSAPLRFPLTYLLHGSSVVGQSLSSAGLRGDLGHVLSSRLNLSAYVAGAGTGSSLVAEASQYGMAVMVLLLVLFYLAYRWYFSHLSTRVFLLMSPLIFQQLVFSPRDTMFPNTWGLIKLSTLLVAAYLISGLVDAAANVRTGSGSREPEGGRPAPR